MSASKLHFERVDEAVVLSTQLHFELPAQVEEALQKGIPIFFVAQLSLARERWYWFNLKLATTQRHIRLSFQPLTKSWRIKVFEGELADTSQGLTLAQNFTTLGAALNALKRLSRWKIADAAELEPGNQYLADFIFELDTTRLPRPLQIGTLGQSDWLLSLKLSQALPPELFR